MQSLGPLVVTFLALLLTLPGARPLPDAPSPSPFPAVTRRVHLGIDRVRWDYFPPINGSSNTGPAANRCTAKSFEEDQLLFVGDGQSINDKGFVPSSVYDKIVFRQYTDASFTHRTPRPHDERHLGLLGPLLRVAVGDELIIVLRGLPLRDVRDGEHSAFAFELTGLPPPDVRRAVQPGEVLELRFQVPWNVAPAPGAFADSHMILYQGTVGVGPDGSAGMYKGLLGPLVVYRKGAWRDARELVTVLWVGNENKGGEEGDVEESNLMHAINGYVYCSLPGLEMTDGEMVRWYFGVVGNEVDVHTAHMHGLVGLNEGGAHTDSVRLVPGTTASLNVFPDNVGTWLFHCHINDHIHAGMQALFTVHPSGDTKGEEKEEEENEALNGRVRKYFVQAEDAVWDYAPGGKMSCEGRKYGDDELIFVEEGFPIELGDDFDGATGYGIGSKYVKSRYVEYTDASFTVPVERDDAMEHLGLMGPVLRARVGEEIVVHFRNRASKSLSMHPHGVLYTKAHEGAPYNDGSSFADKRDDNVAPGSEFTYRWEVPERAGPGPGERQEAKLWIYHSHGSEIADTYAGLFGAIVIVHGEGYDEETLRPVDGTREVFLHMSVMSEGGSFHIEENVRRIKGNRELSEEQLGALQESDEFAESNLMHAINGYLYCNGPMLTLRQGQPTRFYFYALGTEVDIHTPMIGSEVLRLDVRSSRGSSMLLAGSFSSALVTPRATGVQEIRCNVNDHVIAGMRMLYTVEPATDSTDFLPESFVTHYISAEEIDWDYTPLGKDGCNGRAFGLDEEVFTLAGPTTPGSRYVKAVYRAYTDGTFSQLQYPNTTFSGVVGPLLHFEVGETVRIIFRNRLSFDVNLQLVGLDLISSTSDTLAVQPGGNATYTYHVRAEAGPSQSDRHAVPYVYYSSVDLIAHTAAGLTGVLAVTKRGDLNAKTRMPVGVEAAYPLLFNIFRENESPLLDKSLAKYATEAVSEELLEELEEEEDWLESNAMHSVNGYLYGNNPVAVGDKGSKIRFYVFGYGSEASMHAPVFAGQLVRREVRMGSAANGVQILPFNAETVDVELAGMGLWPIVCAVADHVLGGMKVCLRVR